jgi:hypothetical protein
MVYDCVLSNCTVFLPGCKETECTTSLFCLVCLDEYFLTPIDATNQVCTPCLPGCKMCSDVLTCYVFGWSLSVYNNWGS